MTRVRRVPSPRSRPIKFKELDLPEPVRQGIQDAGFVDCTPIQSATLPFALEGRDIAGQAQTGTGKTGAFLIATFTRLLRQQRPPARGRTPRALMIAPTRELAIQIKEEAELLGRHCGFNIHAVYGGIDYQKQADAFEGDVDILIGTPGRLIDYFKQRLFALLHTEILVIDEADRMFDMGFIDDIRYMMRAMSKPAERTSYVYSATLPQKVLELAYEYMHNPEAVTIEAEKKTADNIEQLVYHVGMREKFSTLLLLMEREKPERCLIFVNTRSMASELARRLNLMGYDAMGLAGDVDQKKRLKVLRGFKDKEIQVVVATDVASRGLHVDDISHVFNYDLPQDAEDYVHRIGRTARAGASGKAYSLACEQYVYSLEAIEEFVGKKLPSAAPDTEFEVALTDVRNRWREVRKNSPAPPRHEGRGGPGGGRGGPGGGRGGRSGAGGGRGGRGGTGGGSRDRGRSGGSSPSLGSAPSADAAPAKKPAVARPDTAPAGADGPGRKRRRRKRSPAKSGPPTDAG